MAFENHAGQENNNEEVHIEQEQNPELNREIAKFQAACADVRDQLKDIDPNQVTAEQSKRIEVLGMNIVELLTLAGALAATAALTGNGYADAFPATSLHKDPLIIGTFIGGLGATVWLFAE